MTQQAPDRAARPVPDSMRLPPYAYVPGHHPHPTRSPAGHCFGQPVAPVVPLDVDAWQDNAHWLEGIELFEHGYYWEAHEAWEGLWAAAGRSGSVGDLLNGLIKLAAAGVKIRQGLARPAARLGKLASERFRRAQSESGDDRMAGLAFAHLQALATQASTVGPLEATVPEPAVIVFEGSLRGDAPGWVREALEATLEYHQRSKHQPGQFARALGYMDWDTQPDPFRRYEGAPTIPLALEPVGPLPRYEPALVRGHIDPAPVDASTVGRLFQDSLGLSAWKEAPGARWALRVNPSSGNLHPTEGYLIAGEIQGLSDRPAVFHYAPHLHALELRSAVSNEAWRAIAEQLPRDDALLVGLSSIHWREAWKYGERAFRYCQHDVGHAIACIAVAAAGLGWEAHLLEGVDDDTLAALLGIDRQAGPEAEHPDCLIAVYPSGQRDTTPAAFRIDDSIAAAVRGGDWQGLPNALSDDHHDWPAIDAVATATKKRSVTVPVLEPPGPPPDTSMPVGDAPISLRSVIHGRRSAVALDGRTGITRDAFHQILLRTQPGSEQIPFTSLPWRPCVDLLLFVHRVRDVAPGLYVLVRDPQRLAALREAMDPSFVWRRSDTCPDALGLYLLKEGDARGLARQTSCNQDIAADGVFAVAMLAEYRRPLQELGASMYRRLYWETGVIGQVLYLEAEASGIRGTGIGCFFDDLTHRTFGLEGDPFQVLYHFTMGGPVEDTRLQTHPPYDHLTR